MQLSPRSYQALGFDDRWVRLIGIPLIALLINLLLIEKELVDCCDSPIINFIISLIFTVAYWEGNRKILIYLRLKYAKYNEVKKRILIQAVAITLYSIVIGTVVHLILSGILLLVFEERAMGDLFTLTDFVFSTNVGLGITYSAIVLYECIFFFQRWKTSVIEAEHLKLENVQTQLESLKNQVNPHFLFNSLNTLTSIIPKDPELSVGFVQKLSKVYRYVLEVNATELIELEREWNFVQAYLFLLSIRHGESLKVDANLPVYFLSASVVPLSLQILIENAVKHNVVSAEHPLHIKIYVEGGKLWVENALRRKKHIISSTNLGLQNIRRRYLLLSKESIDVRESDIDFKVGLPLIQTPVLS